MLPPTELQAVLLTAGAQQRLKSKVQATRHRQQEERDVGSSREKAPFVKGHQDGQRRGDNDGSDGESEGREAMFRGKTKAISRAELLAVPVLSQDHRKKKKRRRLGDDTA
jgi:hypothetical protein